MHKLLRDSCGSLSLRQATSIDDSESSTTSTRGRPLHGWKVLFGMASGCLPYTLVATVHQILESVVSFWVNSAILRLEAGPILQNRNIGSCLEAIPNE